MKTNDFLDAFKDPHAAQKDLNDSICQNLQRILNNRQGMLAYNPEYGLPDIHGIYMTLPESGKQLAREIEAVIATHEKRLNHITVNRMEEGDDMRVASYLIQAQLSDRRGSQFRLLTHLYKDGSVGVQWE